jgi:broad specificity phosphatase PhoE
MIASTRRRSIETATAVADGKAFATDPLFIEAPLPPPPWPRWIKMSPKHWGFFARFWWWFFDNHAGQESRAQAELRADQAADLLIDLSKNGQDVLLVAHGFFNTMIGLSLQKRGLKQTRRTRATGASSASSGLGAFASARDAIRTFLHQKPRQRRCPRRARH